jgi:hypothetical protein
MEGYLLCYCQFAGQFSKQSLTYTEPVISSSICVVPLDLFGGYVITSDSTVRVKPDVVGRLPFILGAKGANDLLVPLLYDTVVLNAGAETDRVMCFSISTSP